MQQQVGVVHQQQQALFVLVSAVVDGIQAGGGLLGGGQGGQTLGLGIQGLGGLAALLQRVNQAIQHIGPELAHVVHRVLLFGKAQRQPVGAQLGVVVHGQRQTLHQGGFAHAARANQQGVLPYAIGWGGAQGV